jgi:hypothetical protein
MWGLGTGCRLSANRPGCFLGSFKIKNIIWGLLTEGPRGQGHTSRTVDPIYVPRYNEQHKDWFRVIVLVAGCKEGYGRPEKWLAGSDWIASSSSRFGSHWGRATTLSSTPAIVCGFAKWPVTSLLSPVLAKSQSLCRGSTAPQTERSSCYLRP